MLTRKKEKIRKQRRSKKRNREKKKHKQSNVNKKRECECVRKNTLSISLSSQTFLRISFAKPVGNKIFRTCVGDKTNVPALSIGPAALKKPSNSTFWGAMIQSSNSLSSMKGFAGA
mmetsp:Transcript_14095/g.18315  ORF Transcript_14095/g.18315 Transcript_14095/m.18315 type:complete len:116 (+) Transcript_14095:875-1222(+)